MAAANTKTQT